MTPPLLEIRTIQELLQWYETNLCNVRLLDPRGYRVRFGADDFVHFIKLKNKYGQEPRNRRLAVDEIRRGSIQFIPGRFDEQRSGELSWACAIVTQPDVICKNWQTLGTGSEAYVRAFGGSGVCPVYRVLICKVLGQIRQAVTIFPREGIGERELRQRIWPPK